MSSGFRGFTWLCDLNSLAFVFLTFSFQDHAAAVLSSGIPLHMIGANIQNPSVKSPHVAHDVAGVGGGVATPLGTEKKVLPAFCVLCHSVCVTVIAEHVRLVLRLR